MPSRQRAVAEQVVHRAHIHWAVFVAPGLLLVLAVLVAAGGLDQLLLARDPLVQPLAESYRHWSRVLSDAGWPLHYLLGAALACAALGWIAVCSVRRIYTRIVVTDKRLVLRVGMAPSARTLRYEDIESLKVRKSLFGWLFNFGSVEIVEACEHVNQLRGVAAPNLLKSAVSRQRSRKTAYGL